MHLPSPRDLCDLIRRVEKGSFLCSADVARAYRQLPLDPGDWPLVCFRFQGSYYTDISLPFTLRCAAAHCQDVTSTITRELNRKGAAIPSYIDDFGGVAMDQATAATHFCKHAPETYGKCMPNGTSPSQSATYRESYSKIQLMLSADTI